jgi:hypothetical protein
MARRIGDNIINNQFHKGFFVPSKKHIYTRFDCFEPLALLHLYATFKSKTGSVPVVWPSSPLFVPSYRYKQEGVDRRIIYTLTELTEPPLSLQEAAAIGDVNMVRSLLEKGVEVDSWDGSHKKTALQRAAMSGHKDVVELVLAKGAKTSDFHTSAWLGDLKQVKHFVEQGTGVNTKDDHFQWTPLHWTVFTGSKHVAEFLLAKKGETAISLAKDKGHTEIVELLRKHGAKNPSKTGTIKSERFNDVADPVMTGESPGLQQFGNSFYHGDVNGDGYEDLFVSAIRYPKKSYIGRVYLYYGPLSSDTTVDKIFTGEDPNNAFGIEVTARGDVDGDNCNDLLISIWNYPDYAKLPRTYFYYGGSGSDMDAIPDLIFYVEKNLDDIGSGLDLFDIDNDGYDDILIAARGWNKYQGRAQIYWGSSRETMDNVPDFFINGENRALSAFGLWQGGQAV